MIAVFGQAIYAGREVSLWPPHVAAYQDPIIQNCKTMLDSLPQIRRSEEDEVHRVQSIINDEFQQLSKIEQHELDAHGFVSANAVTDVKSHIEDLRKELAPAFVKLQERADTVLAACRGKV